MKNVFDDLLLMDIFFHTVINVKYFSILTNLLYEMINFLRSSFLKIKRSFAENIN